MPSPATSVPAPASANETQAGLANEGGQLHVVHLPKSDNFRPWPILIALQTHPFIAIITRQVQHRSQLKADKSLMVVRSRINQMTENFFLRPFAGRRPNGRLRVSDVAQPIG